MLSQCWQDEYRGGGGSLTPGEPAGLYTLTASFAGNAVDLGSTVSVNFGVNHEQTTLTYTGPITAANGQPLTRSAHR